MCVDKSCQVTALCVAEDEVYLGTNAGYMVVLQGTTLRPLAILPCHGSEPPYIQAVLHLQSTTPPLAANERRASSEERQVSFHNGLARVSGVQSHVVSIGRGYRDLIASELEMQRSGSAEGSVNTVRGSNNYMLLWRTGHWTDTSATDAGDR